MSKRMATDELQRHIEEAVGELHRLLNSWLDTTEEYVRRAYYYYKDNR